MRARLIVIVAALAVIAAISLKVVADRRAVRQDARNAAPTPGLASPSAVVTPEGVRLDRDPAAVFQRAFWRRPGPDVRVVHAERREWLDQTSSVQRWQWFIALDATPEFQRWLLKENPFGLTRTDAPAAVTPTLSSAMPPPAWFPTGTSTAAGGTFATYHVRGSALTVLLDEKSGKLFASDAGGGFAAAAR